MGRETYKYTVDVCDVPEVRRKALQEYRLFRSKCLEYIRSDADTSVSAQIHRLAWHTAVFKTLNEARKLEPHKAINGAMWELLSAGYATIVTIGIRRLVDRDERTDSLWNVLNALEKRPELLRRENYVCYDGVPYDGKAALAQHVALQGTDGEEGEIVDVSRANTDWSISFLLHTSFDRLCGQPSKRKRLDTIPVSLVASLKAQLDTAVIKRVCHLADRRFAHAERISSSAPIPLTTFNDVEEALKIIVRVTNFLSAGIFYDAAFGAVVPTPQYDVLAALDRPWIEAENLPALHQEWRRICKTMDDWVADLNDGFLPADPTT